MRFFLGECDRKVKGKGRKRFLADTAKDSAGYTNSKKLVECESLLLLESALRGEIEKVASDHPISALSVSCDPPYRAFPPP